MPRPTSIRPIWIRGLILIALLATNGEASEQAIRIANEANGLLRTGDYEAAIQKFDEALTQGYSDPRLLYNKAVAHYRMGEADLARQLFTEVTSSANRKLARKARYNLGNVEYRLATTQAEHDKSAAINQLQSATHHYRKALAADRSDIDARTNIELANRLIQQWKQEQEQDKQQQQQEQQQQEQQQQDQQQQDRQQQDQQQNQQQAGEAGEESPASQSEPNQPPNQDTPQDQGEPQDDESSTETPPTSTPDENESNRDPAEPETNEQSSQQPQADQQQAEHNDTNPPKGAQPEATEGAAEDETAGETPPEGEAPPEGELTALNDQPPPNQEASPPSRAYKEGQAMTFEEAQKMLQAVRDRNLRRRLQKLRQLRTNRVPVSKDW